jgi:hypothetical protein
LHRNNFNSTDENSRVKNYLLRCNIFLLHESKTFKNSSLMLVSGEVLSRACG